MDDRTVDVYSVDAVRYAKEWLAQPSPDDMYALLAEHFRKGGDSADIGCGAGRDSAWLNTHGYPCVGFDASPGLLGEAAHAYPDVEFRQSQLPDLAEIADASFDNVLCETVIMHLPASEIAGACRRLAAILKPGGCLYLSWRIGSATNPRDQAGRLYSSFDAAVALTALGSLLIVLDEEAENRSSGKRVHRVVARRPRD